MRSIRSSLRCASIAIAASLIVSCTGAVSPDAGHCAVGTERPCSCDGGASGTHTCIGDGSVGACICIASLDASADSATPDASDSDASVPGELGALCMRDDQCTSNICLMVGRCSRPCAARADCPTSSNWQCLSLPGRGQICACPGISGMEERACNGVDDNCDGVIDETSRTCDGMCVDIGRDLRNCGACGLTCGGGQVCSGGACSCPMDRPDACGGACVSMQTDVANCGACGNRCRSGPSGTASCVAGMCRLACAPGTADCDGNPDNGCEIDASSDVDNCGGCGTRCSFANAGARCSTGACVLSGCDPGYANCNGMPGDGCETDTRSSLPNCGACGTSCMLANAAPVCASGMCAIASCSPGFGNCDTSSANGCEVTLASDTSNCGTCGNRCPVRPGSLPTCAASTCGFRCNFGVADCDADPGNGCETPTASDPLNCGACGSSCITRPHATAQCLTGTCGITCDVSYSNCDGNSSNGCEADIRTDVANCGSCGRTCAPANSVPQCNAGACGIGVCNAGFENCDASFANGCEANLQADLRNCGTCGRICPGASAPSTTASCSSGACAITCATGFDDCDGMLATGCETSITSTANCGTCGNACAATFVCTAGACACPAGSTTCTGRCVNTASDTSNCGSCGNACAAGLYCVSGACVIGRPTRYTLDTSASFPFIDACSAPGRMLVLAGTDDGTFASTLPFALRFWATDLPPSAPIMISSNGNIAMNGSTSVPLSGAIPPGDPTNPLVAAFWHDLVLRTGVCIATVGTAPNRQFVVEWNDAMYYSSRTGNLTFEIIFNEGSNVIDMAYQTVSGSTPVGIGLSTRTPPAVIGGCPAGAGTCAPIAGQRIRFVPSP